MVTKQFRTESWVDEFEEIWNRDSHENDRFRAMQNLFISEISKAEQRAKLEVYKDIINKLYNTNDYKNALSHLEFWLNENINQLLKGDEPK